MDYYTILQVGKNASLAEIKQAYRKLAFQYHPDHNPHDKAQDNFQKAKEAYDVLSDPKKRMDYEKGKFYTLTDKPQETARGIWAEII